MSAEHRKPVMAFVLLALLTAGLVGVQRADAQSGRLLAVAVGASVRVQGTLPPAPDFLTEAARQQAALLGPAFEAVLAHQGGPSAATLLGTDGSSAAPHHRAPSGAAGTGSAQRPEVTADRILRRAGHAVGDVRPGTVDRVERHADRAAGHAAHAERKAERRAAHAERKAERRAAHAERKAERRAAHAERKAVRALERTDRRPEPRWHLTRSARHTAQHAAKLWNHRSSRS